MKYKIGLVLVLTLVFGIAGTTLAAPLSTGSEGQVCVYGELADTIGYAVVGIGYNLTDQLAIGGFYSWGPDAFGVFAQAKLDPILLKGEVVFMGPFAFGQVTALYLLDLDPFTLGLGGGFYFNPGGTDFYVDVEANLALGEKFSLFGAVRYDAFSDFYYEAGISVVF